MSDAVIRKIFLHLPPGFSQDKERMQKIAVIIGSKYSPLVEWDIIPNGDDFPDVLVEEWLPMESPLIAQIKHDIDDENIDKVFQEVMDAAKDD